MAPAAGHDHAGARAGARPVNAPLAAADAARRILDDIHRQPALRVPLDDALDSVLAEDVVSPIDIPPWDNSAMDGYAVRGDDLRGATAERPVRLRVVEHVPAGSFPTRTLGPGESARIFTGAPIPAGADTVVRQEDTDQGADDGGDPSRAGRGRQHPPRRRGYPARRDRAHRRHGARRGAARRARVARGGAAAGLPAAAGRHPGQRRRDRRCRPARGDPERPEDREQQHAYARGPGATAGGEPVNLGIARDTPASLREHLRRALDCDLLVTTAGISVGEHDYVRSVLDELGAEQRFWRIRMRPGVDPDPPAHRPRRERARRCRCTSRISPSRTPRATPLTS